MRYYGKKPLRRKMKEETDLKKETVDAICWDIFPDDRQVRVKIQGSDTYVVCDYPQNFKSTPKWLRTGQAVQLRHTGGQRGRMEIIDYSLNKITPQPGGANPTIPTPIDAIISGLQVIEVPNRQVMKVGVSSGRVRFSGATSSVIYIKMTASSEMVMGYGFKMGGVADVLVIDAAPGSGARYDLIVVGSDLVFDVVKGTASSTPTFPSVPSGHLQVGWVLVNAGATYIDRTVINQYYSAPMLSYITVTSSDSELDWSELTATITVTAKDQFGNDIIGTGGGWYVTLSIVSGNGTVDDKLGNDSTTAISKFMGASASTTFGYTRDQASSDQSPTLEATISGSYVRGATAIILYDASGDPM